MAKIFLKSTFEHSEQSKLCSAVCHTSLMIERSSDGFGAAGSAHAGVSDKEGWCTFTGNALLRGRPMADGICTRNKRPRPEAEICSIEIGKRRGCVKVVRAVLRCLHCGRAWGAAVLAVGVLGAPQCLQSVVLGAPQCLRSVVLGAPQCLQSVVLGALQCLQYGGA